MPVKAVMPASVREWYELDGAGQLLLPTWMWDHALVLGKLRGDDLLSDEALSFLTKESFSG